MAQSVIQAGTIVDVSIHALPASIRQHQKSGNDLVVLLQDGDSIRVQDFCSGVPGGATHLLVPGDGTVVNAVPVDERGESLASALAGQEDLISRGVAGLGSGLIALRGGTDPTDPTNPTDGSHDGPGVLDPVLADGGLLGGLTGNERLLGDLTGAGLPIKGRRMNLRPGVRAPRIPVRSWAYAHTQHRSEVQQALFT